MSSYRPRIEYGWAPGGVRPADMRRFAQWCYERFGWARGDLFYFAKFNPELLRGKYDYWREKHAA